MKRLLSLLFFVLFLAFASTCFAKESVRYENTNDPGDLIISKNIINACISWSDWHILSFDTDENGRISVYDVLNYVNQTNPNKYNLCKSMLPYHENCIWYQLNTQSDTFTFKNPNFPYCDIRFNIYFPDEYSKGKEYALLVCFHGLGGEQTPTPSLFPSALFYEVKDSKYKDETIIIQVQCPQGTDWPHYPDTRNATYELITDLCEHLNIDKSRMYLIGHSYGSIAVSYMIEEHPNTFAAGVMSAGAMKLDAYKNLPALASTPLRMYWGDKDEYGYNDRLLKLSDRLKELGAKNLSCFEFTNAGHGIFGDVCRHEGLIDWIFTKVITE